MNETKEFVESSHLIFDWTDLIIKYTKRNNKHKNKLRYYNWSTNIYTGVDESRKNN